jgi:hypothetical protein
VFASFVLSTLLLAAATASAQDYPTGFPRNSMAPDGPDVMDVTPDMIGEHEVALRRLAAEIGPDVATEASPTGEPVEIGGELGLTVADFVYGDYDETFVAVLEGTHGIIMIEQAAYENYDAATDEFVFPNPSGVWRTEDRISMAQLEDMLTEFDEVIYPTDTSIFGQHVARGAEGQKVWMLIHNIRDEAYYIEGQESYVAGYFSSAEDWMNNRNMIHIDSYDWANRVGSDGARPYLYEGVFAHEFEHLIHFDQDPDEPSWIDEGMADMAGFMCGYGHSAGHIAYYMVYFPVTALTFWGGGLESYGASYLFALYMYEQFGGAEFISALVQEQANGIEGVENTLAAFGFDLTFDEVFDTWTIANYVDDTRGDGRYGYESLDIGSIDTWGYTIPYSLRNYWFGPPATRPFALPSWWLAGPEPMPYTAHYYWMQNPKAATAWLDGADFAGTPAFSGTYEWYSGMGNWAWRNVHRTIDVPATGATLSFVTTYSIEEDWDYAYVEVYDHSTGEWTTLDSTAPMANDVVFAQDNPNTPLDREPMTYAAAGRWHAFTGRSDGWVPVTMDLSPFAGHAIDLYFTSWQDGAYTEDMIYVDDISIPELGIFDDVEAGEGGWTAEGWIVTDGIVPNGFAVTTIDTKWVSEARYPAPADNSATRLHAVQTMDPDPDGWVGEMTLPATPAASGRVQVTIVTNHADHLAASPFSIGFEW